MIPERCDCNFCVVIFHKDDNAHFATLSVRKDNITYLKLWSLKDVTAISALWSFIKMTTLILPPYLLEKITSHIISCDLWKMWLQFLRCDLSYRSQRSFSNLICLKRWQKMRCDLWKDDSVIFNVSSFLEDVNTVYMLSSLEKITSQFSLCYMW